MLLDEKWIQDAKTLEYQPIRGNSPTTYPGEEAEAGSEKAMMGWILLIDALFISDPNICL